MLITYDKLTNIAQGSILIDEIDLSPRSKRLKVNKYTIVLDALAYFFLSL